MPSPVRRLQNDMGNLLFDILTFFLKLINDAVPPPDWLNIGRMGGGWDVGMDGTTWSDPFAFIAHLVGRVNYFVPADILIALIGVYWGIRLAVFLVKVARRVVWN
jgi:hypothetical protein